MTNGKLKDRYEGSKFTVIHCEGALQSFQAAITRAGKKSKSLTRQMAMQIKRLADGHRMSKESFPAEGDLPKRKGQHKAKKFNALKRIPIRGYCWLSDKHERTYFISHYVYKDYDKLKESDTTKVGNNWRKVEEQEDDR